MGKSKLSYAEAYTDFLKYCSKKEKTNIDILVNDFRSNHVEERFRLLYEKGIQVSNAEYYKRLRGK